MNKKSREKIIKKLEQHKKDADIIKKASDIADEQSADTEDFAEKFHDVVVDEVIADMFSHLKD